MNELRKIADGGVSDISRLESTCKLENPECQTAVRLKGIVDYWAKGGKYRDISDTLLRTTSSFIEGLDGIGGEVELLREYVTQVSGLLQKGRYAEARQIVDGWLSELSYPQHI
jgi:hypothetical protein